MTSADARELMEQVRSARQTRGTIKARSSSESLDEAYTIQSRLFGDTAPIGYKLGLVSRAKQLQMGHDTPIFGRVSSEMLLGREVALDAFIQPRCEPEIAVILREPLPPDADSGHALTAVGASFLAIDILDSIWEGYRFSLQQVVADGTSGGGFVVGDQALPIILDGRLRMRLAGEPVADAPISGIGNWPANLAWLATQVGGIAAGTTIFLGSPAPAVQLRAGVVELLGPRGSLLTALIHEGHRHDR